jgi:hypothetical protein
MNYTVVWVPPAEEELATIWLAAADQAAVTAAVYRLEQRLSRDPLHAGEARWSSVQRVVTDLPLGIDFEVIEDDKRVLVQSVWTVG